jgi:hypothetical protein
VRGFAFAKVPYGVHELTATTGIRLIVVRRNDRTVLR